MAVLARLDEADALTLVTSLSPRHSVCALMVEASDHSLEFFFTGRSGMLRRVNRMRLVSRADADALSQLLQTNRDFLAPWEPVRSEDYVTAADSSPKSRRLWNGTSKVPRRRL